MGEIRVLAPTGILGSGFLESSLEAGLARDPHFIGCDAGSTDAGPSSLGSGRPQFSRASTKRDLRPMLSGARRKGIPLLIGSAGMGGTDIGLAWLRDIAEEVAREEGLHFRMALIRAEQDKAYLKRRLAERRIRPLKPAPPISEALIDRSEHIVGMMGTEPFLKALDEGAEVVLAGRSSDTSIFAALPVRMGAHPGVAWHAAKVLECGTACVTQRRSPDSVMAILRDEHFLIEPLDPRLCCTPQSVASHTLYENADPFHIVEPGGVLDASEARYEAETVRTVRVTGSRFQPAERYTVKLEGAEKAGYQTIIIGSIRDPIIVRQVDRWLATLRDRLQERVDHIFGEKVSQEDYTLVIRAYGKDGTMGPMEPLARQLAHELCLLFEVTAPEQQLANDIAATLGHLAIHHPVPEWHGLISALAFPFAPPEVEKGLVYRFNLNHVVEPDDPCEMFPLELVEV
ncbi:MAG: acyclic terpene utilization AtuA family protein [Nitrospinota bacterium]